MFRWILILALSHLATHQGLAASPVRDHSRTGDTNTIHRTNPLFHYDLEGERTEWGIAPFLSHVVDTGPDTEEWDFLYPLFTYDRFGTEWRIQFFQLLNGSGGGLQDGGADRRFTIFPFWFQQRSSDPSRNYTALFPFYGTLRNRLFRDEIKVVMAPFYLQTRKRDLVTDNYFLPFVHVRHGDGSLHGWQFFPLYGQESKQPHTRTNHFGVEELIGGHSKTFALWPFFANQHLELGTTNAGHKFLAFPFYSREKFPTRSSFSYLWPFGYTQSKNLATGDREWDVLYPFLTFIRGPHRQTDRFFPIFSLSHAGNSESDTWLWPVWRHEHSRSDPLDRERTRIFWYFYTDLKDRDTRNNSTSRRTTQWPLFAAERHFDGTEHLQVLAPLEAVLPVNSPIRRNWSPLWSLWTSDANPAKATRDWTIFWTFAKGHTGPNGKKGSLFFGLVRYETDPAKPGRRWTVHLPGRSKHTANQDTPTRPATPTPGGRP